MHGAAGRDTADAAAVVARIVAGRVARPAPGAAPRVRGDRVAGRVGVEVAGGSMWKEDRLKPALGPFDRYAI